MKQDNHISNHLMIDLWIKIILVAALLLLGLELSEVSRDLGYGCCILAVIILVVSIAHYEYMNILVKRKIQTAGLEQNESQLRLFMDMPVPYVMTDEKGNLLWHNNCFTDMVGDKISKKSTITQIFPEIHKKVFPASSAKKKINLVFNEKDYRVECSRLVVNPQNVEDIADEVYEYNNGKLETEAVSEAIESSGPDETHLLNFYFFDVTAMKSFQQELQRKSLVAGLIYIDNFEEVLENMEEVRQSLLLALVERKIVKYVQSFGGVIKKFEKDKFFFIFEQLNYERMKETKFSLLDEVRTINIGNDLSMTLSIGVGVNAQTYAQAYDSARIAMDMALGRGGDQAVVREGDMLSYYGGKTQKVEKSTRVKARVKAHALREIMMTHDRIFIMGHKYPDADCVGSALGIYRLSKTFAKTAYIVMDDKFPAIEPIVSGLGPVIAEAGEDIFITGDQAQVLKTKNSALIIVDVNVPSRTECPELLKQIPTIVVLDHHRVGSEVIRNSVVSYVEPYASSACEMVAEILQYIAEKPKLRSIEADALYSGILVDTDNFVTKAGVRTFEAAAYLRRMGADVTRVRKMFRDDMEHNQVKARVISKAEVFKNDFVISSWDAGELSGATVVGAKAANELLNVKGVRASFVLTKIKDTIYISARSIDDVNVQVIMERLGGGGHLTVAATQIRNSTLSETLERLKQLLLDMEQNGDL